jgi:hypothetical protein
MLSRIKTSYLRPWDRTEKILLFLTVFVLLLDAVSTIMIARDPWLSHGHDFVEQNPVVLMMQWYAGANIVIGILSYNLLWIPVVLLFRPIRSVELSLAVLHITGSGVAALDNMGILLYRTPFIASFIESFGLQTPQMLLVAVLGYLTIHFYGQLQRGPIEKLPRKIMTTIVGLGFAMIAQFAILVVWIRHIYKFFWF